MRLLALLFVLLCSSAAQAQHWWVAPNTYPNPPDTALLPKSLTLNWAVASPWLANNGTTWDAIWSRNAGAGWFRPLAYTQPTVFRNPVYPYPYTCYMSGTTGFRCRDLVRQIDRYINCPTTIAMQQTHLWRSEYNPAWPEYGLYTWDRGGPGKLVHCNNLKTLNLHNASVTANGQQINCSYGPPTIQGPGTALDAWCYYW